MWLGVSKSPAGMFGPKCTLTLPPKPGSGKGMPIGPPGIRGAPGPIGSLGKYEGPRPRLSEGIGLGAGINFLSRSSKSFSRIATDSRA